MNNRIGIHTIEIHNPDGKPDKLMLPEIDGVILMKKTDLVRYFNVSPSTVNEWFYEGKLKRYRANGKQKVGSDKGQVYISLGEFLAMDEPLSKPAATGSIKIKLTG